jgi:hypothetical protein
VSLYSNLFNLGNPFPSIQPLEEERLAQLKKMSLNLVGANKNKEVEQIPREKVLQERLKNKRKDI